MGLEKGDSGVGKGHRSAAVPVSWPTGADGAGEEGYWGWGKGGELLLYLTLGLLGQIGLERGILGAMKGHTSAGVPERWCC